MVMLKVASVTNEEGQLPVALMHCAPQATWYSIYTMSQCIITLMVFGNSSLVPTYLLDLAPWPQREKLQASPSRGLNSCLMNVLGSTSLFPFTRAIASYNARTLPFSLYQVWSNILCRFWKWYGCLLAIGKWGTREGTRSLEMNRLLDLFFPCLCWFHSHILYVFCYSCAKKMQQEISTRPS